MMSYVMFHSKQFRNKSLKYVFHHREDVSLLMSFLSYRLLEITLTEPDSSRFLRGMPKNNLSM